MAYLLLFKITRGGCKLVGKVLGDNTPMDLLGVFVG